ncbi:MAG TPA: PilZ domain-containing protein [Pyrinomonadaceae bacterium]|jgi:hypothetical protein
MSGYGDNRRREPRVTASHEVRVEVGTAILNRELGTGSLGPLTLYGHTRDLSLSGLGIVIPAADMGPRHSGECLPARVRVGLPNGGVEVEAEAVHWAPLDEMGLGRGVLIGVRVTGGGESLELLLRGRGAAVAGSGGEAETPGGGAAG